MRKLLLPILLGMLLGTGAAQVVTQGAQYVFVAPSGVCLSTNPIQVLTITGEIYTCQNVSNSVGTWAKATSGGGGGPGTVTSVALTAPNGFSVGGSPIVGAGTLALTTTGLTTNTLLKAISGGIGNGSITGDDGTHSPNSPNGLDMGTLGSLANQIANNAATGTTVNRLACDDGAGLVIICPHATSTTNQPIGTVTNNAGTTGSATVAFIGFITVCFDNQTTAKHYAVGSTTTDGCLHDTGSTSLTAGQPNYFVWTANSGALTNGVYRLLTADDFAAAGCTATCVTAAAALTSNSVVLGAGTRAVKVVAGITTDGTSALNLGTDNSVAGSILLSNSAANAHNIFASGATTTNTIKGFSAVPTTGHIVDCTVASTTCTLHDSGVVTANVVNASSPGAGIAHFAGSTQTVTSSLIVAADITAATITHTQTDSTFPTLVASGTSAMGTSAISSGTCATVVSTSATGTLTTDTIIATPNADPTGVTGYAVASGGSLYIQAYPTADHVNYRVCNPTSGSLTPSALTLNWKVIR